MRLVILGCGTSTGVPVIGCHCEVCSSSDPRNRRTRSSILIQTDGNNILIDTTTDLRGQALSNSLERVDAVLYTHAHADHIHGIDDLRSFNLAAGGRAIPCYGEKETIKRIRSIFEYIFRVDGKDGWKPNLTTTEVSSGFSIGETAVSPIEIMHGEATILGYRIGSFAYLTDCNGIPPASMEKLKGLELLILGALRHKPHPTHFSINEAIEASNTIGPKRTVFTHLGHNLDYTRDNPALPKGFELAYDGMTIEL
ncbi:MAG: MBL fold metallo-hydrolase [Deltaproteobacteria bacterium]|nr:MBL fold metallo-hydrolase [Deltaproteobacteria bacterium]